MILSLVGKLAGDSRPLPRTNLALFQDRHKCPDRKLYIIHRQARNVSFVTNHQTITVRHVEAVTALLRARELNLNAGRRNKHVG
jgi:hypothetical protein